MDLQQINQGLEKISSTVWEAYKEYHEAKTDFDSLEEQKKTMLASIASQYSGSEAYVNRMALSDAEYKKYVVGLNLARRRYNKAWARIKSIDIQLAAYQSLGKNYNNS